MLLEGRRISFANSINAAYGNLHHAGASILGRTQMAEDFILDNHLRSGSKLSGALAATARMAGTAVQATLFMTWLAVNSARKLTLKALTPGTRKNRRQSPPRTSWRAPPSTT